MAATDSSSSSSSSSSPSSPSTPVKRLSLPLRIDGGQYTVGDPATTPADTCLAVNNLHVFPGRLAARPPFTYDNLMAISGLANFDDNLNHVTRLVALSTAQQIYEKATSGETWSGALGTAPGVRVSDFCNYMGKLWVMMDNGSAGLPSGAFSGDQAAGLTSSPFNSPVQGRTITPFNERLYITYPRVTVTNALLAPFVVSYNWNINGCKRTNVTATNITTGTSTVCRLFPTSLSSKACSALWNNSFSSIVPDAFGNTTIPASSTDTPGVWRIDLRAVDAINETPLTLLVYVQAPGPQILPAPYVAGDIIVRSGYVFRCITAGSANGAEPAWTTTGGGTSTWNTAVFTNIGSSTIAAPQLMLSTATDNSDWQTQYIPFKAPWSTNGCTVSMGIEFWNDQQSTLTAFSPIDVSYKDGVADGAPTKANKGQQITLGDYYAPFFNQESSATATIDLNQIIWSEIREPKSIRAANYYQPAEFISYPTAAAVVAARYIVFYRNGFIQFQGTSDPDIPIRRERVDTAIGCIGPRAHDVFENTIFFIGENDIYAYNGAGSPQSITGDGMREIIMARGSGWVENAATYNRPLLHIDKTQFIVWVYTQKGILYAYNISTKKWSTHYITGAGTVEVDAMLWNRNTQNFYVSFGGFGLTRMDYSTSAKDVIDNTGTAYSLDISIVKVIEAADAARYEFSLEDIILYYQSSITQTNQLVTASFSFDQGATYPHTITCTPSAVSTAGANNYLPLRISGITYRGPSITMKLSRGTKGGEASWALSPRLLARIKVLRDEEYVQTNPTPGTRT